MAHKKEKKKRRAGRRIIVVLLLAVIAFCLYKIIPYYYNNWISGREYSDLQDGYVSVEEDAGDDCWYTGVDIDVAGLQEINPDVIGWLRFDDTDTIAVDYPVLYADPYDAYLHTDINGDYSYAGCLFIITPEASDFSDIHCTIYGHNMRNGSMFGTLKKLKDEEVFFENQYFTFYTADMAYRFCIFSEFTTPSDGYVYQTGFIQNAEYTEYLTQLLDDSDTDTGAELSQESKTVTLSTCTPQSDDNRYTVHAVCVAEHVYGTADTDTEG